MGNNEELFETGGLDVFMPDISRVSLHCIAIHDWLALVVSHVWIENNHSHVVLNGCIYLGKHASFFEAFVDTDRSRPNASSHLPRPLN